MAANPMGQLPNFGFSTGSVAEKPTELSSFEDCKLYQDESHLILLSKRPEGESFEQRYKIVCSINFKSIIEIKPYVDPSQGSSNKYNLRSTNVLQIKFVRNFEQY